MRMPSRSWKQFVGGIKLAVSRGGRGGKWATQNIFCTCSPSPLFAFWLSPFVWECGASLDTMPAAGGSWSGLVPRYQCNKLGWIIIFNSAASAGPLHWHRQVASSGEVTLPGWGYTQHGNRSPQAVTGLENQSSALRAGLLFIVSVGSGKLLMAFQNTALWPEEWYEERNEKHQGKKCVMCVYKGTTPASQRCFSHSCAHLTSCFACPDGHVAPAGTKGPRSMLVNGAGLIRSSGGTDPFSLKGEKMSR